MIEATSPGFFSAQGQAAYETASVQDYGCDGDQRPYQIVSPAYPAPQFLRSFTYLTEALRECQTLCQSTGQPFRLVKWGSRIPCRPCRRRKIGDNRLPSLRFRGSHVESRGALAGYPEALPIMDATAKGSVVFGPNGEEVSIGSPDFRIWVPDVSPNVLVNPQPLPADYMEAIRGGEYLASRTGRRAFICSSFGADCKGRDPRKWVPVVYVQPGGLARRYPDDLDPTGWGSSVAGSTAISQVITPEMFQQLLALSDGGSNLPWNAT